MNTLFSHPERQNNFQRVIPNFFLNCSHYFNLGGKQPEGKFCEYAGIKSLLEGYSLQAQMNAYKDIQ